MELNKLVLKTAQGRLDSVADLIKKTGRGGGVLVQIQNNKELLSNLIYNPDIVKKKNIVLSQIVVLYVGSLESHLSDILKTIGNRQPELFSFDDEREKISFSQSFLKDGFSLGDVIVYHIIENKKFSFQDLKSAIDIFNKYLSLKILLDEKDRDRLILMAAMRNAIVHNSSSINRKFINQIRDTEFKNKYAIGGQISINDEMLGEFKASLQSFSQQLTTKILEL